jgi:hypothetical protein
LESGRFLGQSGLRIRLGGKGPVAIDPERTLVPKRLVRNSSRMVPSAGDEVTAGTVFVRFE